MVCDTSKIQNLNLLRLSIFTGIVLIILIIVSYFKNKDDDKVKSFSYSTDYNLFSTDWHKVIVSWIPIFIILVAVLIGYPFSIINKFYKENCTETSFQWYESD
jgi:uncharacterized membrane protein